MSTETQPLLEVLHLNVVSERSRSRVVAPTASTVGLDTPGGAAPIEKRTATDESERHVLKDISLSVFPGEMLGVVGESGAGKSVLGLTIMALTPPELDVTGGSVIFGGQNLLEKSEGELRKIRGKELGMVLPGGRSSLNPMETVGTQIMNVIRSHLDIDKAAAFRMAIEILKDVGINDPERRISSYPHEMSGGMAQRILIAEAMVCEPTLLIADEPTSDLDVTVSAQVMDNMQSLIDQKDAATILLTRDLGIIAQYCDRIAVLHEGELVEYAAVKSFFKNAQHPYCKELLTAAVAARSYETEEAEELRAGGRSEGEDPGTGQRLQRNSFGVSKGILESPEYTKIDDQHFVRKA